MAIYSYPHKNFVPIRKRDFYQPWIAQTSNGKLRIVNNPPNRQIYIDDKLIFDYFVYHKEFDRLVVFMLTEANVISQSDLAHFWGVHPNTITNWRNKVKNEGPAGLLNNDRNSKPEENSSDELDDFFIEIWENKGPKPFEQMNTLIYQEFGYKISERTFYRIKKKLDLPKTAPNQLTLFDTNSFEPTFQFNETKKDEAINENSGNLRCSNNEEFTSVEESKTDVTDLVKDDDEAVINQTEPLAIKIEEDDDILENKTELEETNIENEFNEDEDNSSFESLEDGETVNCKYGGVLIFSALINSLFKPIFRYVLNNIESFHSKYKQFNIKQLLVTLILMFLLRIYNPEQTKSIDRQSLGILFGRRKGVCCKTLRSSLNYFNEGNLHTYLPLELTKQYVREGYVELGVVYYDGHFVPYYGKENVSKGYFTQRRLAMPGHYQYWGNDINGRPIYFFLKQSFENFTWVIIEMVQELIDLRKELNITGPLIVVFDREGYSAELFKELDKMSVGWITWKKHCKYNWNEELFTHDVNLPDINRDVSEFGLFRTTCSVTGYRDDVETIVLLNKKSKGQATLITNLDRILKEDYSPVDTVKFLKNRWSQENFFKFADDAVDLNHQMGYDFEESTDDYYVPNPEYKDLEKEVNKLERKYKRVIKKRNKIIDKYKKLKYKKPFKQYLKQKGNTKTRKKYKEIRDGLREAKLKFANTPREVPYSQLDEDDKKAINFERSIVITAIKAAVFNMKCEMKDLASKCFKDRRELSKFMETLINADTTITRDGGTYIVELDVNGPPRYKKSAELLLEKINSKNPRSLDGANMALHFNLKSE